MLNTNKSPPLHFLSLKTELHNVLHCSADSVSKSLKVYVKALKLNCKHICTISRSDMTQSAII